MGRAYLEVRIPEGAAQEAVDDVCAMLVDAGKRAVLWVDGAQWRCNVAQGAVVTVAASEGASW